MDSMAMRRRAFLGGMISAVGFPARAVAPETSIRPVLRPDDALARVAPGLAELAARAPGGQVSAVVADARTGEVLEAFNPIRRLPPASVLKAVTALYALEALGPQHRFRTRLVATGPISGGRLDGDLVLVGGGDPGLDTDGLHALGVRAREAGLREVTGRFLVTPGAFPTTPRIDPGQPEHVGYNPAVSGLNLNFNRVHFSWRPGSDGHATSMEARTERFRPAVATSRMRIADRSLPVYTYAADGAVDAWTVARRQLGGSGSRWLPVRNPALYAGDVMRTMLRANGIVVGAPVRVAATPGGTTVAQESSAPLDRMARAMLRYSTNLTAECMGIAASRARGARVGAPGASADAMAQWLGSRAGGRRARLDDHSGLNGSSRLSALDMVRALTAPGAEARLRPVLRAMTAEGRQEVPRSVGVAAKTGTLNFANGLGGYFDARDGRPLAFAVFIADTARRDGLSVAERDRPQGGRAWARRARQVQYDMIERWWAVHG